MEAAIEGYEVALASYKPDEVETAARWWLEGKNGDGNENYSFAPSPPQLARLCEKARYQFSLPPSKYPSLNFRNERKPQKSEEERADFVAKILKSTGPLEGPAPQPERKRLDEVDETWLQEFRARRADERAAAHAALQERLEREAVEAVGAGRSQEAAE